VHAFPHTPPHIPSLYIPPEGIMCSWYSVCMESNSLWWVLNQVVTTIFCFAWLIGKLCSVWVWNQYHFGRLGGSWNPSYQQGE